MKINTQRFITIYFHFDLCYYIFTSKSKELLSICFCMNSTSRTWLISSFILVCWSNSKLNKLYKIYNHFIVFFKFLLSFCRGNGTYQKYNYNTISWNNTKTIQHTSRISAKSIIAWEYSGGSLFNCSRNKSQKAVCIVSLICFIKLTKCNTQNYNN